MHVLTADGDLRDVSQRKWPLAGLEPKGSLSVASEFNFLKLVGDANWASYARLYRENPWVNAAIRTISWGLARSPLRVYELKADGQREVCRYDLPGRRGRDPVGVRLDRELNAPTGRIGPQRRMRATMVDYLVHGNALWDISQPEGVWRIPWSKVEVLEGEDMPILGYRIKSSVGRDRFIAPEDVIHFCADDDPDSVLGVPPICALKHTLALHEALQRHLVHFFENSARPSANLRLDKGANDQTIKMIQQQVRELYASPENAGRIIVTTGDFQAITAGHDQSQIIELAKLSREEIAGVFRIPGPVLGFLDNAIKSNVKELREQHIRDVIGAWAPAVEDDIMAQRVRVDPTLQHHFVEFDLDAQLRPDLEGLADVAAKTMHTVSTNERRRWFNLPDLPYPEADTVPSVPGGGYLGMAPEPAPAGEGEVTGNEETERTRGPRKNAPEFEGKTKPKKQRDADLDGLLFEPK